MSGLKARLLQKKREQNAANNPKPNRQSDKQQKWQTMQAFVHETSSSAFVRREIRHDLSTKHGQFQLRQIESVASLIPSLIQDRVSIAADELIQNMLFFDTETTGLGVGAGNVPFMIGLGYFENNHFVVNQCLVRNAAEEHAMLSYVQNMFLERPILVTYNGRTFDWPIVKNRFIVNRIDNDRWNAFEPYHLDLLYTARSLWKHVLSSCRLGTVEMEKLGVVREDDVPGSLAPELYFRYLQNQDAITLKGVFEHNEQDILSLVTLSIQVATYLSGAFDVKALSAEELYRMAMWLERMGRSATAQIAFAELKRRRGKAMPEYFNLLAEHYKRKREWNEATALWRLSIEERERLGQKGRNVHACIELAKYFEHRKKDLKQALEYAEWAKQELIRHPMHQIRISRNRMLMQEIEHRIARLQRKLGHPIKEMDTEKRSVIQQLIW